MRLGSILSLSVIAAVAPAACSSSNTVVALTINAPGGSMPVLGLKIATIRVTYTPRSAAPPFTDSFAPSTDHDGGIIASFFHRSSLPSGMGGVNDVLVVGLDDGGATVAMGTTVVTVIDGMATTAAVALMVPTSPPPADSGSDTAAADAAADAADAGGN
jgi:hypothetical protein